MLFLRSSCSIQMHNGRRKKQPKGIKVEWLRQNLMFGVKCVRESNERSKQNRILRGCKKSREKNKKERKVDCSYLPVWDFENGAIIS